MQKELLDKINAAANLIHIANLRSAGNYIISSSYITEQILNLDKNYLRKKKLERILNEKIL
ncbi:hypothetical protein M0Q97_10395 [Candidatus Dojkabacteria bacterium]|jgi:hypothetical protein|nr:hypothetical protein [Candidatus Dojkabacteria bacterium]